MFKQSWFGSAESRNQSDCCEEFGDELVKKLLSADLIPFPESQRGRGSQWNDGNFPGCTDVGQTNGADVRVRTLRYLCTLTTVR